MRTKTKKVMILFLALIILLGGPGQSPGKADTNEIIVTSSLDSGAGSLREALTRAKPGTVIRFSQEVFPEEAPVVIYVESELPVLDDGSVTIDASDAGVVLDGSRIGQNVEEMTVTCLVIFSNNNTIMGLQIINFRGGLYITDGARENRIGGSGPGEGNIIGGNWDGITLQGVGTSHNVIIGNYIGTDASGENKNSNGADGIWVGDGAGENIIGGRFGIDGNLISGNNSSGIVLDSSSGNIVTGNIIGLDVHGEKPLGNGAGISIVDSEIYEYPSIGNIVGGLEPSARNLISGNDGQGISINLDGASENKIIGNDIGLNIFGGSGAGNQGGGVAVVDGANNNEIGPNNRIAYNMSDGILIAGIESTNNAIIRNSIFGNSGKAINILNGGNLGLDTPEITQLSSRFIRGSAGSGQVIEIYSDTETQSAYFEGETLTDLTGGFSFLLPTGSFKNRYIAVTARDQDGNTSQLSESMENPAHATGKELPGIVSPAQVSTEPAVISTNLVLAAIAVIFFGFTSTAINDILKNHPDQIRKYLAQLVPDGVKTYFKEIESKLQPRGGVRVNFLWIWILIIGVNALIESFLDPDVPFFGKERYYIVLPLFFAGLIVSGFEWMADHYSHKYIVKKAILQSEIRLAGILLGIFSVVFSRLMNFTPGYLYGIVGVVYILPRITEKQKSGLRALIVLAVIFIGGLLLWGLSALLPDFLQWMEPYFLTAFIISLQGVLFELIPLDIFDGSNLWRWRKGIWILFFSIVFFLFFHLMLNPSGSDIQALQQNSVQTLLTVMAMFGLVTLIAWIISARYLREDIEI